MARILSFFLKIYLFIFIFGCVGSSFLCEGFLQLRQAGATLHRGARPLTIAASLVVEHRLLMRRLSSCGSQAQLLRSMWDLPRPGLEPVSPALAGRFSTTAPPGKPQNIIILTFNQYKNFWRSFSKSSVYFTLRALAISQVLNSHMWLTKQLHKIPYLRYNKLEAVRKPKKCPWYLKEPVLTTRSL